MPSVFARLWCGHDATIASESDASGATLEGTAPAKSNSKGAAGLRTDTVAESPSTSRRGTRRKEGSMYAQLMRMGTTKDVAGGEANDEGSNAALMAHVFLKSTTHGHHHHHEETKDAEETTVAKVEAIDIDAVHSKIERRTAMGSQQGPFGRIVASKSMFGIFNETTPEDFVAYNAAEDAWENDWINGDPRRPEREGCPRPQARMERHVSYMLDHENSPVGANVQARAAIFSTGHSHSSIRRLITGRMEGEGEEDYDGVSVSTEEQGPEEWQPEDKDYVIYKS
uniref:Uncharacterized protein n=1 Tax=Phaeomonas parva TaxID=124430 RepID=A0A7S1XLT4_9STRA|mmetsp:Transcript_18486/g.56494  ORF Transcript_18486/g.56494 Transcript_18486/m.56494 type:complete len:283 (+) Transcript_18486:919-1767(+)